MKVNLSAASVRSPHLMLQNIIGMRNISTDWPYIIFYVRQVFRNSGLSSLFFPPKDTRKRFKLC